MRTGTGAARGFDLALATLHSFFVALFFAFVVMRPTFAAADEASPQDQLANTGQDFFKPPQNLFQPSYQYKTAPGSGGIPGSTSVVTTDTVNLRVDHRIDLTSQSMVVLRTDLPFLAKDPITSSNPDGNYLYGVGDTNYQAAFIRDLNTRWAVGSGVRLITPTGGDTLGSGKWQIMPIGGLRYALPEINSASYFEPIVRYDVSFAGNPAKKNISNLQFAPTFTIGLPRRWFVTFYQSPDIRVNYGDPVTGQTGRLFLPFDVTVGRKLTDHITLSLEVGVPIIKNYPLYNFKTWIRLNLTY